MTNTKKGLSARDMQRQLGHKCYTTIWAIMYRICTRMGKRELRSSLKDMVEFYEGFIEKAFSKKKLKIALNAKIEAKDRLV